MHPDRWEHDYPDDFRQAQIQSGQTRPKDTKRKTAIESELGELVEVPQERQEETTQDQMIPEVSSGVPNAELDSTVVWDGGFDQNQPSMAEDQSQNWEDGAATPYEPVEWSDRDDLPALGEDGSWATATEDQAAELGCPVTTITATDSSGGEVEVDLPVGTRLLPNDLFLMPNGKEVTYEQLLASLGASLT